MVAFGAEEKATFAGGCFWCMEHPFEKLTGVRDVVAGYTGGKSRAPTYEHVSSGISGHVEAVQITFDPATTTYAELLDIFWRQIDPTDSGGQFVDRGRQYQTVIFYHTEEQRRLAEESRERLAGSGRFAKPIMTAIRPYSAFYPAEDYHQNYYRTQSAHYERYRGNSGREEFIRRVWADDPASQAAARAGGRPVKDGDALRRKLTPVQFHVTQECGTEPAFRNAYWDNKRQGIYVDSVSGEPLFSSGDKFDSGTGWPSFTRLLEPENVIEKTDRTHGMQRVEVRSTHGDSHLGHVFPDGPQPTGRRYCINSAALRFIPREDLQKEGYGHYRHLFP